MKATAIALAATLALGVLPVSARPLHRSGEMPAEPWSASRRDTVLAWDDGNYGTIYDGVTGLLGMGLAVRFEAPPWADRVTGIQFYIMPDGTADPTADLIGVVWRPDADMLPETPPVPCGLAFGGYPKDAWLEVNPTQPVDISDPEEFPDGIFFVGLYWQAMWNPIIGIDFDPPIDCQSYRDGPPGWENLTEADVMIRAVVAGTPTPVETTSWTAIKALFR
ncbi:MAG TPA: hypothetical protein VE960_06830 [bacterium]|nr:hypothetical protein [bacterium]